VQVVIEAVPEASHLAIELIFTGVRKRRMSDVVAQGESFGKFLIELQRTSHGAGDLRHFNGVREPVTEMVRDTGRKDLRLILQPAKSP